MPLPAEHHLPVTRTARYFTLGDPGSAEHIWFALHGYGQLASTFLGYLATLDNGSRLIVAPEALSRFYLDDGKGPPGASWMTREDRENEISDYVRYLDQVCVEVMANCRGTARSYALGFSQGVATLGRWLDRGSTKHEAFCLWAGTLPQELALTEPHPALAGRRVALVAGHGDKYLRQDWLDLESGRMAQAAAGEVRRFPFHGGHRLDRTVLSSVAAFFESDPA
jgi:predicted esterase